MQITISIDEIKTYAVITSSIIVFAIILYFLFFVPVGRTNHLQACRLFRAVIPRFTNRTELLSSATRLCLVANPTATRRCVLHAWGHRQPAQLLALVIAVALCNHTHDFSLPHSKRFYITNMYRSY